MAGAGEVMAGCHWREAVEDVDARDERGHDG
jgi:hypothetical protein